nr:hypothetical protein [Tanacetum cinerariifolium]
MECTMDITEFFRKLKFICHWANPIKDFKWSNVSGVKLSSFFKLDDTFLSLQVLSDLNYLFNGFMDYLWSRELNISNFGSADRKIIPVVNVSVTPPKMRVAAEFCTGALLHNITATDT